MSEHDEEIRHYGVPGMRWGVRRATRRLMSANKKGNTEKAQKAIASLNKHKGKITKKLDKLGKESEQLKKKEFASATKYQPKIAELDAKIAKFQSKSQYAWTEKGMQKNAQKAQTLTLEVNKLKAKASQIKAAVDKNEALTRTFSKTLSDVDSILVANGKKYIKK